MRKRPDVIRVRESASLQSRYFSTRPACWILSPVWSNPPQAEEANSAPRSRHAVTSDSTSSSRLELDGRGSRRESPESCVLIERGGDERSKDHDRTRGRGDVTVEARMTVESGQAGKSLARRSTKSVGSTPRVGRSPLKRMRQSSSDTAAAGARRCQPVDTSIARSRKRSPIRRQVTSSKSKSTRARRAA